MKPVVIGLLLLGASLSAQTQVWLRDPAKGQGCRVIGVSTGSPAVLTCARDAGFSMSVFAAGDTVVVYDIYGTYNVNGIRKITSIGDYTVTLSDIAGSPINTTDTFIPPSVMSTTPQNFSWGYVSPVALYTLNPHPRTWGMSGPSSGLAAALADAGPSGRANPGSPQYNALVNSYNGTAGTYRNGPNGFLAAAQKWWADGQPTSGPLFDYATWLPKNLGAGTVPEWGTMACDEIQEFCGAPQYSGDTDYFSLYSQAIVGTFDLTHSQYDASVLQDFANWMFNDLSEAHGGLGVHGDVTRDCAKPAAAGIVPWGGGGQCGSVWLTKHHVASQFSNPTFYGGSGGSAAGLLYGLGNQGAWTKAAGYFMQGLAVCGDDGPDPVSDRACRLATMAHAFMWDHAYSEALGQWGMVDDTDDYYTWCREEWMFNLFNATLFNAVVGWPSPPQSFLDQTAFFPLYVTIPYSPYAGSLVATSAHWGQYAGYGTDMNDTGGLVSMVGNMFKSPAAAPYISYWMQNVTHWWNGILWGLGGSNELYTPWYYFYADPGVAPASLSELPKQRLFASGQYGSECTRLNLNCSQYTWANSAFVSKTGWGASDTLLFGFGFTWAPDSHMSTSPCTGCLRIYKNQGLLGGNDSGPPSGSILSAGGIYTPGDNVFVIGGAIGNYPAVYYCQLPPFRGGPNVTRWAGANPTGPQSGTYTYAMFDLTNNWCETPVPATTLQRIYKHVLHFKPAGGQDYVVVYVDAAATDPIQFQEYVLYRRQQDEAAVLYSPGLTANRAAKTVTIADTATRARINSQYLSVQGGQSIYFDDEKSSDTDCTYSQSSAPLIGGVSPSCRFVIGGSTDGSTSAATTTAEWAYVHQPCANTTCLMPSITQPACTASRGTCGAIQVADSDNPAIAIFGRQGALLQDLSVTTQFSGTGQYLVVGMAPGRYIVRIGGVAVGSPLTVAAGDNSLQFNGVAGAVSITVARADCETNRNGAVQLLGTTPERGRGPFDLGCLQ